MSKTVLSKLWGLYQRYFWELSEPCLEALRLRLKPGMRTLETGSGRSTFVFEEAGCEHIALEHNAWLAPKLPSVVIAPLKGDPPWYDWRPSHSFDLILIDGPAHGRSPVLKVLPQCMKSSTIVFIDDTDRRADRAIAEQIAREYGLTATTRSHWALIPRTFTILEPRQP